jgi:ubiquinone/menaquinone biosynthesis C-methylase UbiE
VTYLETTKAFYRDVAVTPDVGLCCVQSGSLNWPGLTVPQAMYDMNYGCGTTVQPGELSANTRILYVGVGGGLEALQFAYFTRQPGSVIAVEPVAEMRQAAQRNLALAATQNDWFDPSFVTLLDGDAFNLPVAAASVDVVAQNCLFNIFAADDLRRALSEAHRVLTSGGRLSMSDPIATRPIPAHLQADERLRAMCLSGAQTYDDYIHFLVEAGFGQVEVRARRPYRLLDRVTYGIDADLLLDSLDTISFKVPIPADGACIFTGKTAIYNGSEESFDDQVGHILPKGVPTAVCDKTAAHLGHHFPDIIRITPSTWYYQGDGCC